MNKKKIAWCITGSGHYLKESIELLLTLENVDLYLLNKNSLYFFSKA